MKIYLSKEEFAELKNGNLRRFIATKQLDSYTNGCNITVMVGRRKLATAQAYHVQTLHVHPDEKRLTLGITHLSVKGIEQFAKTCGFAGEAELFASFQPQDVLSAAVTFTLQQLVLVES